MATYRFDTFGIRNKKNGTEGLHYIEFTEKTYKRKDAEGEYMYLVCCYSSKSSVKLPSEGDTVSLSGVLCTVVSAEQLEKKKYRKVALVLSCNPEK